MREAVAERGGNGRVGGETSGGGRQTAFSVVGGTGLYPCIVGMLVGALGATWKAEPLPPPIIAFAFVYKVPPPHLTTTVPPPGLPPPLPSLLPSYPVPSTNCPDRFGGFFLYGN